MFQFGAAQGSPVGISKATNLGKRNYSFDLFVVFN